MGARHSTNSSQDGYKTNDNDEGRIDDNPFGDDVIQDPVANPNANTSSEFLWLQVASRTLRCKQCLSSMTQK